jgi:peptide/nickel transport system permease protein
MKTLKNSFRELLRYPSAILGLIIILFLLGVAVYALVTIPYSEAVRLWRGGEDVWYQNPKYAAPSWFNYFTSKKEPLSFAVNTADGGMTKTVTPNDQDISTVDITYSFDYSYDGFPDEMILYFKPTIIEKFPFVSIAWITPDGRKIRIADTAVQYNSTFRFSQDPKLQTRLNTEHVMQALFSDPNVKEPTPLKGKYQLVISGTTFEQGSDIAAEFVLQGKLFGLAGTDHYRRDLLLPLLYGTPIALAFGLIAALGTSLLTMTIAAIGTWYGGWVEIGRAHV